MGMFEWVDPAREWFKSRPEAAKGLLGAVYQMATDPQAREAAMARYPVFDRSQSGQQMIDNAMNAGPSGLLGKIVWHGSPHKFDKFDASKIGTGEGAQAYGHGVYLADAEDVARGYKTANTYWNPSVIEKKLIEAGVSKDSANTYAQFAAQTNGGKVSFDKFAELINGKSPIPSIEKFREARRADLPKIKDTVDSLEGTLYKADLPDEWIPKMLDWDKPLSQQPENVRLLAKDLGLTKDATGKDVYSALSNQARDMGIIKGQTAQTTLPGSQGRAAADLSEFGIPGIRYLDGGSRPNSGRITMLEQTIANLQSRGASKAAITNAQRELDAELARASYNYVVFPGLEDKVKILERNGIPLGLLGGR